LPKPKNNDNNVLAMKFLYFVFLCFLLIPLNSLAANSLDVVINEIAWMGTLTSANDEWIELYDNTSSPIDLSGWTLKAEDDSPSIALKGTIPALGYFLLERTDDETVAEVKADQIYTGALENTGEKLELRDNNNFLVDIIDCSSGWFGGDNATKQTMERKNLKTNGSIAENWQNSQSAGGTPKAPNSSLPPTPTASPNPTPSPTPQPSPTDNPPAAEVSNDAIAPTNIFVNSLKISEFIPNPKDSNGWVELSSDSDQKIDISNWKLKSGDKTFIIPEQTSISPNEFLVLYAKTTGLILENSDSVLELYYPNGEIAQKIDYQETKENWSIAKIGNDYLWTDNPTPRLPNKKSSDPQELQPTPPKEQNLNYQTTPESTPLETELSPTPEEILKENPENKSRGNILNSPWLGFVLIIVFGFLAGLGLVKIRK